MKQSPIRDHILETRQNLERYLELAQLIFSVAGMSKVAGVRRRGQEVEAAHIQVKPKFERSSLPLDKRH